MRLRPLLVAGLALLPLLAVAKDDPEVIALNNRLTALQANPDTADVARFERLQAQQAINAFAEAKRRDRDEMRFLADRRVEIAETAARTALARRQLEQVEGTRSELLIEASRREAARARQEAERLRMQSQMQAEEAERLRQQAEAEMLARQDAEQALSSVASRQTAKLSAAQQKAAQLAREEAELTSGAKLPPSKFESRGEVFTVPAGAFDGGQATLSGEGSGQAKALAEYLQIGKKGRVNIVGYAADAAGAQKRAEALRDALVAAGVSANRLQVSAGKGGGKGRSAEVVVLP
ncbi:MULTISPECIES: OmpA family protein [Gammaproteobacteria]|uniref:Membrane protein n=1 Tax=Xanthomonas boreopolis TaxID=86183 RepID=A0A919KIT7_9XANT|nr:OmpA family protein [Pseudomonas sp. Hp2]GHH56852.1 membrane protein [[Pseudomonas] boreopolis]